MKVFSLNLKYTQPNKKIVHTHSYILFKASKQLGEQQVIVSHVGKCLFLICNTKRRKEQACWTKHWNQSGDCCHTASTSCHGDGGLLFAPAVSDRSPFFNALTQKRQSSATIPQKFCTRENYLLQLTPSGFNTLVTVTDWKKERALGRSGVWPTGGAIIWSRPPEDTAESRSKKCVKQSVLSVFNASLSKGFQPTSVHSALLLWKHLGPLLPKIKLWTQVSHNNQ